ncbi:MAG: hypothetical protein K2P08_05425, partial [Oscillospiraceae bacterium]|nr:hypothetical protein [Oscillospiraceae bacterium]
MKKLLYIYNPTAGRKTAKMNLSDALEVFTRQGYEITVRPTQARGDAAAAVRDLGPEFDRVVCSGGDGTLNETVRGVLELPRERRPVLGYIPAGTTNDFSRTLELPRTLPELAEAAGAGVPGARPPPPGPPPPPTPPPPPPPPPPRVGVFCFRGLSR